MSTQKTTNSKALNRALATVLSLLLTLGILPIVVLADSYGAQGDGFKVNMIDPSAANITTTHQSNGDYLNVIGTKYDPTGTVSFTFDAGDGSGTNYIDNSMFNGYVKLFTSEAMTDDSLIYTYGSSSEISITDIGNQGTLQRGRRFRLDMTALQPATAYYLVFVKGLATDRVSMGNYNLIFRFETVADATAVDSVSLDQTALLFEGLNQTYDLTETIVPDAALNKAVIWTSSDASVASVNANGLVTAKKAGTAVITVTTADGGKTATCDIDVRNSDKNRVMNINAGTAIHRIASSGVNYAIQKPDPLYELVTDPEYYVVPDAVTSGDTLTMNMQVYPNGGMKSTWFIFHLYRDASFTDEVENGCAVSVTDYTAATVTVPTTDLEGDTTYYLVLDQTSTSGSVPFGKNVVVEFTTGAASAEVSSVLLDYDALILDGLGQTFRLHETVLPASAVNKNVAWASSNNSIVTVGNDGAMTAKAAGNAVVTVTTEDGGKTASCSIEVRDSDNQRVLVSREETVKYALTGSSGYYSIHEPSPVYQVLDATSVHVIPSVTPVGEELDVNVELFPTTTRSSTNFIYKLFSDKELTQEISNVVTLTLSGDTIGKATVDTSGLQPNTTYYLALDKTTSNGTEPLGQDIVFEFTTADGSVTPEPKPLTATLSADPASVNEKEQVTLTASARGGTAPYTYKFIVYNKGTNAWYKIRDFASDNTCTWYSGAAGSKTLFVDVKDSEGTVYRASLDMEVIKETTQPLTVASFQSSKGTTLDPNTETTLRATATGGKTPYTYKFIVYNTETNQWYKIRDFASENTCTWYTGTAAQKNLYVDVKDSAGTVVRQELAVTVGSGTQTPLSVSYFTSSKGTSLTANDTTTLVAKATGGSGSGYTYKFIVYNKGTGAWYKIQDYSTKSSCSWYTGAAGSKTLYVDIKDSAGNYVRQPLDVTVE